MPVRRLGLTLAIIGALALALAPVASAAPPVTTINIHVVFEGNETFTASGGVVCASGVAVTDPFMGAGGGSQGRGVFTFHLIKTLTCDDLSGSFQIKVEAANPSTSPGTVGGFTVVGGTGDYTSLHGGGSLLGYAFDGGLDDVYTGRLSR
jgi:hypothetical protein